MNRLKARILTGFAHLGGSVTSEVKHFLELEEKLRTLNSEIQGFEAGKINKDVYELAKQGYYNFWKFRDLMRTVDDARVELYDVDEHEDYVGFKPIIHPLIDWSEDLLKWKEVACRREGAFYKCEEVPAHPFYAHQGEIRSAGITCGFISPDEEKISMLKAVDSFTNCLHSFAVDAAKAFKDKDELEEETAGICKIIGYPSDPKTREILFKACKTFAKWVDENEWWYSSADTDEQEGLIFPNKIQFTIGGYVGHKSEIDLKDMEFLYYDHHYARAEATKYALERGLNLECSGTLELSCKLKSPEDAIEIARFLTFLPSMDIHLNEIAHDIASERSEMCEVECHADPEDYIDYDSCVEDCEISCDEDEACKEECIDSCVINQCADVCGRRTLEDTKEKLSENLRELYYKAITDKSMDYGDILEDLREW